MKFIRIYFICLFPIIIGKDRKNIVLHNLFTQSSYPSIDYALKQISSLKADINLKLNITNTTVIPCDIGTSVKKLFNIINKRKSLNILVTDACQNLLSYLAEAVTYFHLPVFSFADSDLSLSSIDRYPFYYNIVPSDRAHNLVRKEILQYFNWTRFGLIYQHGAKYTLIANDLSNLTATDKRQWEINLTRGISYRHGLKWNTDNAKNIKAVLNDFKTKDVRIIVGSFNQTIAAHMFCHAAQEHIYGSRYQWIIFGSPSMVAWWNQTTDCSSQDLIRAINGTIQTRIPPMTMDNNDNRPPHVSEYFSNYFKLNPTYFDAYAYDTIWSLNYIYRSKHIFNRTNIKHIVDNIDFVGATGHVRYLNGERIGEVLVEQYVACRMMKDGSCKIPCYAENKNCNLTLIKIFLGKHSHSKYNPPILHKLSSILWHGEGPSKDRTNQISLFNHIYFSIFLSVTVISSIGLIISILLICFNIYFRSHRFIRMSSPSLNNLIIFGCLLAYISMILIGINSSLFANENYNEFLMNIICPVRVWVLCISFTLAFGSMFSKTWRVYSIFRNIYMNKRGIQDSYLLIIVGILLCIDLFFLITWQIVDPIRRKFVYDLPYRSKSNHDIEIHQYREECRSEYTMLWFIILIIYKIILMSFGSFLSWKTRHVTIPALNDSRYIGLSVYIVFICSILASLVTFIPSEQIQISYLLRTFFILTCTTVTLCLVFVPKIIQVYDDPYSKKRHPRFNKRLEKKVSQPIALTVKHLNNAILDNQQLNFLLSMQKQTIEQLIEQLENFSILNKSNIEKDNEQLELERLFVSNDEIEQEQDEEDFRINDDEEDDNTNFHYFTTNRLLKKHIVRTVSLCVYNKIHMEQIYCNETNRMTRYSI